MLLAPQAWLSWVAFVPYGLTVLFRLQPWWDCSHIGPLPLRIHLGRFGGVQLVYTGGLYLSGTNLQAAGQH